MKIKHSVLYLLEVRSRSSVVLDEYREVQDVARLVQTNGVYVRHAQVRVSGKQKLNVFCFWILNSLLIAIYLASDHVVKLQLT